MKVRMKKNNIDICPLVKQDVAYLMKRKPCSLCIEKLNCQYANISKWKRK